MAEVTVRGAGIFGLSIAWVCATRGARVRVIDPAGPAAGASGGVVGALAPHVPENWNPKKQFQLESLLMAPGFWNGVAAAGGGDPGYAQTGRLQPIANGKSLDLARSRIQSARKLWRDTAVWEVIRATGAKWEPLTPTGWLTRDTLSAHLHPKQACNALVAALESQGIRVKSEGSDEGAVIWATGVQGLAALSEGRARPLGSAQKGQAALLRYRVGAGAQQLYADGIHVIPHSDGTVAIGSTSENRFDHPSSTDDQLDAVVERAREFVPALAGAPIVARWAGLRSRARSRAPMLGPWPDRRGHFVANGGFKIGFGMAPKVAEIMSDLVLEERDLVPDSFRVEASY